MFEIEMSRIYDFTFVFFAMRTIALLSSSTYISTCTQMSQSKQYFEVGGRNTLSCLIIGTKSFIPTILILAIIFVNLKTTIPNYHLKKTLPPFMLMLCTAYALVKLHSIFLFFSILSFLDLQVKVK